MLKHRFIYFLSLIMSLACAVSCTDLLEPPEPEPGEGMADLSAEVVFSSVSQNLGKSRAGTAGDAIRDIKSLCVFIYDREGTTLYRRVKESELINLEYSDNIATAPDAVPGGTHSTGETTPKANFSIKGVEFGKYQIYAVANMGDLDEYSDEDIATAEMLRNIPLTWNEEDVPANNQMFGYFTTTQDQKSEGFTAPVVTVNRSNMPLHAWLKRAVSKVTVAVDGSGLYPGVQVWIKSIQIKDIADMCFLGRENTAPPHLIEKGARIEVSQTEGSDGENASNLVSRTQNYPRNMEDAHTNDAEALFFYENMQGTGQNKAQAWTAGATTPQFPDGNDPDSQGYKDNKLAGTYVEVIGYYMTDGTHSEDGPSQGPIIYRFMLGKNTTDNYDAQRNYHFKLTLMLKNNANDNDWHIVYNQPPQILATEPYYISYLYDESMTYPLKIVGGELVYLKAEIPNNELTQRSWAPRNGEVTQEDIIKEQSLGGYPYWNGTVNNPGPWNGFLSLRKTKTDAFGTLAEGYGSGNPNTYTLNKTYFEDNRRGEREYYPSTVGQPDDNGVYSDPVDGDYKIFKTAPGEYEIGIPLYTRARVMVAQTAYTGNNPYAAYNRESQIKITAGIRKDGIVYERTKEIKIVQARRVLNPKAIWRKASSQEPFHIQLKILKSQTADSFSPLSSYGPWRAEVVCGKDWVSIEPTEKSQYNADQSISGSGEPYPETEDNYIDFIYRPIGTIAENQSRGGIIRIYYNNYSCVHTIFVRQGYAPVEFYNTGVMWHTFNLLTGGDSDNPATEVSAPEREGSYFRQYNREHAIAAENNNSEWALKLSGSINRDLNILNPDGTTGSLTWEDITTTDNSWGDFKVKVGNEEIECRIPSETDWTPVINNSNTLYGFGVLYGDSGTETLEDIKLVYGSSSADDSSGKGIRGIIVCDENSGTQLFLPTAATGFGRFKQKTPAGINVAYRLPAGEGGVIQYADRYTWFPASGGYDVTYKPLFYDLWQSEGAPYWLEGDYALDVNFYSFDFSVASSNGSRGMGLVWDGDGNNVGDPSGSDAIHIRLVHDK